jgi:hypothetical protein
VNIFNLAKNAAASADQIERLLRPQPAALRRIFDGARRTGDEFSQTVNTEQVKPSKDMLPNKSLCNSGKSGPGGRAMNF